MSDAPDQQAPLQTNTIDDCTGRDAGGSDTAYDMKSAPNGSCADNITLPAFSPPKRMRDSSVPSLPQIRKLSVSELDRQQRQRREEVAKLEAELDAVEVSNFDISEVVRRRRRRAPAVNASESFVHLGSIPNENVPCEEESGVGLMADDNEGVEADPNDPLGLGGNDLSDGDDAEDGDDDDPFLRPRHADFPSLRRLRQEWIAQSQSERALGGLGAELPRTVLGQPQLRIRPQPLPSPLARQAAAAQRQSQLQGELSQSRCPRCHGTAAATTPARQHWRRGSEPWGSESALGFLSSDQLWDDDMEIDRSAARVCTCHHLLGGEDDVVILASSHGRNMSIGGMFPSPGSDRFVLRVPDLSGMAGAADDALYMGEGFDGGAVIDGDCSDDEEGLVMFPQQEYIQSQPHERSHADASHNSDDDSDHLDRELVNLRLDAFFSGDKSETDTISLAPRPSSAPPLRALALGSASCLALPDTLDEGSQRSSSGPSSPTQLGDDSTKKKIILRPKMMMRAGLVAPPPPPPPPLYKSSSHIGKTEDKERQNTKTPSLSRTNDDDEYSINGARAAPDRRKFLLRSASASAVLRNKMGFEPISLRSPCKGNKSNNLEKGSIPPTLQDPTPESIKGAQALPDVETIESFESAKENTYPMQAQRSIENESTEQELDSSNKSIPEGLEESGLKPCDGLTPLIPSFSPNSRIKTTAGSSSFSSPPSARARDHFSLQVAAAMEAAARFSGRSNSVSSTHLPQDRLGRNLAKASCASPSNLSDTNFRTPGENDSSRKPSLRERHQEHQMHDHHQQEHTTPGLYLPRLGSSFVMKTPGDDEGIAKYEMARNGDMESLSKSAQSARNAASSFFGMVMGRSSPRHSAGTSRRAELEVAVASSPSLGAGHKYNSEEQTCRVGSSSDGTGDVCGTK